MSKDLTPKQKRFCQEYLIDSNATQAAIRAGYSKKTAGAIGEENLRKPEISVVIDALNKKREQRTEITADYVLKNLKEVVERCLERAPVMVREGRQMVQLTDDEGRDVWQFDSGGANKALELLGKHLKLFTDKVEHSGKLTLEDLVGGSNDSGPEKD